MTTQRLPIFQEHEEQIAILRSPAPVPCREPQEDQAPHARA
jgi:hypothetical protein